MDRENYIIPFEPPAADATHPLAEQLSEETQNDTPAEDTPAQETYEDIPAPLQRHAVKQYAGAVLDMCRMRSLRPLLWSSSLSSLISARLIALSSDSRIPQLRSQKIMQ